MWEVGTRKYMRGRQHVQVRLETLLGAPTPGRWTLVINHTRIGTGQPKMNGSADGIVKKKQAILTCAIEHSIRGGTHGATGIVVGDLNLTKKHVETVLDSAAVHQSRVGNLRCWGGEGHAWQ